MFARVPSKDATHFNPTTREKTSLSHRLINGISVNLYMIISGVALTKLCFVTKKVNTLLYKKANKPIIMFIMKKITSHMFIV